MRVLMLSKACIVGQYQTKLESLGGMPGMELTAVVPPSWKDERGEILLERAHTANYELLVAPLRLNGHFHLHYYPTIGQILARVRPDLVHIDEEPYNFATFHALRHARRIVPRAPIVFFTWQNIFRRYPPPFGWIEAWVHRQTDAAIAGSREAKTVLERKGYARPIHIIPQFGVPETFSPNGLRGDAHGSVVIGYAGRLVEEKGVRLMLDAVRQVQGDWRLRVIGSGPLRSSLEAQAQQGGIASRIEWQSWAASAEMPSLYNSLDLLIVPSLTMPNWKEQFGRVIMEAMASGVPVVGSNSGEIPNVIGDAGLVVPEGDAGALARAIQELVNDPARRRELGVAGRRRALERFSRARVVEDTYQLYRALARTANLL